MRFGFRVAAAGTVLVAVALPAHANNPPRPDGVLYLILVFPLLALSSHLAGVVGDRPRWLGRVARGAVLGLLVVLSAAGTELGLLAMLAIVVYGLVRAVGIARRGAGARRWTWAAAAALGSLLAGVGYLWAASSWSSAEYVRGRQKRTMADMRTVGTAVAGWSYDRQGDRAAEPAPTDQPAPGPAEASFAAGDGPPAISRAELARLLVPTYLREVPEQDGWERPLDYRLDLSSHRFQVRSGGSDGRFDADRYVVGAFDAREHQGDLVWADDGFIRWPESLTR